MWTYAVVWDFWTLFGEPCYDFRFRWEARPASLLADDYYYQGHKISEYPDLQKLVKKLHPIFLGGDKEPVTVSLAIQVKKGGTVLANLWHSAVIDLPDIAGKWNTFSMPASADWLKVFTPLRTGLEKQELWGEVGSRQSEVTSAYNSGNNETYKRLMTEIFKEADNNNPESEYIKGQLAKVDRILNYKPLNMAEGMVFVEGNSIIKSFYIGIYEVTIKQWCEIMGTDNNMCKYWSSEKPENYPVWDIGWVHAQEFIDKLNKKTGLKYRFPTEKEWEYGARGGKLSTNSNTQTYPKITDEWYNQNIKPVGQGNPNELGIYDINSNVAEWVNDKGDSSNTHIVRETVSDRTQCNDGSSYDYGLRLAMDVE